MNKTLFLVFGHEEYDKVASGQQCEVYREMTVYWRQRLIYCKAMSLAYKYCSLFRFLGKDIAPRDFLRRFSCVTFQRGKQKGAPRMTFEVENISIGFGNSEWGAPKGEKVFIIKLGKRA